MRGKRFKISFAETKRKLYSAVNALYSKTGCILDIHLIIHLMDFIAVPILCYALEALFLSKKDISSLHITFKRALFKIFKVSNSENLHTCMQIFAIVDVSEKYSKRKLKFESR